jgi:prophage regulatory protein
MSERLIPTSVVLDRICLSKTQLYRLINAGEFPRPIPIGRLRVAFLETEVAAWIDKRIQSRDEKAGAETRRQRAIRAVGGRS